MPNAWRDFFFRAVDTIRKTLPPCHICGEPGAQFCRECGRVACHKHAFTNVMALKSVCNSCMPFDWVSREASGATLSQDWPYPDMPWQILGVDENATTEQVKDAHRSMSKKCHPDVSGGNTADQIAINRARDEMLRMRGEK